MILDNIPTIPGEVKIRDYTFLEMDYRPKHRLSHINLLQFLFGERNSFGSYEKIKKKYKTTGRLLVTNRRIIYNTSKMRRNGKYDSLIYQMSVKDVGDVSQTDATWKCLTGPIVFLVVSLILTLISSFALFFLPIIALVWLIFKYIHPKSATYLRISSKSGANGLLAGKTSESDLKEIYFSAIPGKDFDKVAIELGSLILDLQTNGDDCIGRWISTKQTIPGENANNTPYIDPDDY